MATGQPQLLAQVDEALRTSLAGYVRVPTGIFVAPPGLGAMAGPFGAIALGLDALEIEAKGREEGFGRRSA